MTHRITERRAALLAAVAEASRTVLDEENRATDALWDLGAALDALDAYCPECDDAGVVERVRHAGTSTCDPATTDDELCICEAARAVAEQRRTQALIDGDEAGE